MAVSRASNFLRISMKPEQIRTYCVLLQVRNELLNSRVSRSSCQMHSQIANLPLFTDLDWFYFNYFQKDYFNGNGKLAINFMPCQVCTPTFSKTFFFWIRSSATTKKRSILIRQERNSTIIQTLCFLPPWFLNIKRINASRPIRPSCCA